MRHQTRLLALLRAAPRREPRRLGLVATCRTSKPAACSGDGAFLFHSDLEFTDEPVRVLSLYAMELPDTPPALASPTARGPRRTSMRDLASELDGLTALHVFPLLEAPRRRALSPARPSTTAQPRAEHPVLLTHPVTGARILYITQMQTDSIVGLPEDESEALLERCWDSAVRDRQRLRAHLAGRRPARVGQPGAPARTRTPSPAVARCVGSPWVPCWLGCVRSETVLVDPTTYDRATKGLRCTIS